MKFYIYRWWSGFCIEEVKCKITKIENNIIYFWNDYCKEHQTQNLKNCIIDENNYICNYVD